MPGTARQMRCLGKRWERWEEPELSVKHFRRYVAITNLRQRKCIPRDRDKPKKKAYRTYQEILRCVIPVVCRKTNGEVNISHENTTMVVWIYEGCLIGKK